MDPIQNRFSWALQCAMVRRKDRISSGQEMACDVEGQDKQKDPGNSLYLYEQCT